LIKFEGLSGVRIRAYGYVPHERFRNKYRVPWGP
jgi:hypothetical protein